MRETIIPKGPIRKDKGVEEIINQRENFPNEKNFSSITNPSSLSFISFHPLAIEPLIYFSFFIFN
ncbi:hypothetical protein AFAEC_0770 [Aliarcobacter faecis]|nr:hypothetical protein [Aliarcobacter faecis]QKF72951.1 hypothetical protein AFAEC_0770 [Aliarcobacter faecis]